VTPKDKAVLKRYTAEDLEKRLGISRPSAEYLRFIISEI
jgi:hypothetical protein